MGHYRVGIISDTHSNSLGQLPADIFHIFRDVDLILHGGDVTERWVLDELQRLAPVLAVRGNHDRHLDLPYRRLIELGGVRIGLVHGQRPEWQQVPSVLSLELFRGRYFWWGGFHRQVVGWFRQQGVQLIVFGHFHRAYMAYWRQVMLFSPGAVFNRTPEQVRELLADPLGPGFGRRVLLRHWLRRATRHPALITGPAAVGLLHIAGGVIRPEIIHLEL